MEPKEVEAQLQRINHIRLAVAKVYGHKVALVAEMMFHDALIIGLSTSAIKLLGNTKMANEAGEELARIAAISSERLATFLDVRNEVTLQAFMSFDQLLKEILSENPRTNHRKRR